MNPARKMSRVLSRLPVENNEKSEAVWAKLFLGRGIEDRVDDSHYIASRLNKLNAHASNLERDLHTLEVPPEMFASQLERLRRAILPSRVKEPWITIRQEIGEDIPLMLLWAAYVIGGPNYDDLADEIQDLVEKLDEAEALLDKNILPERLCELLRKHLNEMKSAATNIEDEGGEPFKQSVASLHLDLFMSEDAMQVARNATPEQQKILEKVNVALQKGGIVLDKILSKAGNANQALQFIERIGTMLGSTPTP